MIDKPIIAIIFMYLSGFCILGVQFIYADVLGITLVNDDGVSLKPAILDVLDMDNVNAITANVVNATDAENSTLGAIENAFQIGFNAGKEFLLLLTGTYIFNILYLLGVPPIFIVPMVVVYAFMLFNTVIAKIRGI